MKRKKKNLVIVLVLLLLTLFTGCQIDPPNPGGGDNGGQTTGGDDTGDVVTVDPTGDQIVVDFVNKSGSLIAEISYIDPSQEGGEQRKIFDPPIAIGGGFKMAMKAGVYSFVSFPIANSQSVKPTGKAYGIYISLGTTVELLPFVDNPTDPTSDVTVTFVNKSGKPIGELKYIQAMVQGAGEQIKSFTPPIAAGGQFTLAMAPGNYSFVAFEHVGDAANPVALVEGVTVVAGATVQLTPPQGGPDPAEQCIYFVNLYKEFTVVERRLPGQPAWGTLIPDQTAQVPQSLAVGENMALPFAEGTKFDMRFTTATGEQVELLNITTTYRYGYINITGPATGNAAQEFGKINRKVALINTTGETLTSYYIADQLKMGQPQPQMQFLTTPLAPGQSVSLTMLEGLYSFSFMAGPSTGGNTGLIAVTSDQSTDIITSSITP